MQRAVECVDPHHQLAATEPARLERCQHLTAGSVLGVWGDGVLQVGELLDPELQGPTPSLVGFVEELTPHE